MVSRGNGDQSSLTEYTARDIENGLLIRSIRGDHLNTTEGGEGIR